MSRRVPVRALLRSEWTKLRSLRGAWLCLALYAAAVVLGAYASLSSTAPQGPRGATASALVGFAVGQPALLVLGALVVTTEYRTGTVLTSLTAVPRRTRLLIAKAVVVAAWTAVLTAALAAACVAAIPFVTAGAPSVPLTQPAAVLPIGLQVAWSVLLVVLGLGLGAVFRRTTPAAVAGILLVAVLPAATALAGEPRVVGVAWLFPTLRVGVDDLLTLATQGSLGLPAGGDALLAGATSWREGLVIHAAWALGAWLLGVLVTERRDA